MRRASIVIAIAVAAWLILLVFPSIAFRLGWLVFVAFLAIVGGATFRRSSTGRRSGLLFVLLLAFLPLWVMGAFGLYCLLMGIDASYDPIRR